MLITCPNCQTQFSVPDSALGSQGRKLKCAKCGHKWHQSPPGGMAAAPMAAPVAAPAFEPEPSFDQQPAFDEPASEQGFGSALSSSDDLPLEMAPSSFGSGSSETKGGEDDFFGGDDDMPADSDIDTRFASEEEDSLRADYDDDDMGEPGPIPEVFTSPKHRDAEREGRGGAVLWVVLLALLLGGGGVGAWYFQDHVIDAWPDAQKYYQMAGLERVEIGRGLAFRNYSSERVKQDENEVLVVRGIIANTSSRDRDVPLMRLALFDEQGQVVQEKVVKPPVEGLQPGGTSGFKLTLDEPDPRAMRFEITFTQLAEGETTAEE